MLTDPFQQIHIGSTAENVASKYDVSRAEERGLTELVSLETATGLQWPNPRRWWQGAPGPVAPGCGGPRAVRGKLGEPHRGASPWCRGSRSCTRPT